ncbi:hypothetical protein [Hymenobacter chitinivorans]|uniref:Lipoprotein n=1 Tax=Hymenobacter chitinivorans DSM 11115 TaxID=1121954 RepID=A0A2M9APT5_9BACT|nr:hypothetical protein [Hymenobacter chitinivorans]PJJ47708.1 hypothetical protein CLV45_4846 [Hymenobacter chitinivorans DSM 11115]
MRHSLLAATFALPLLTLSGCDLRKCADPEPAPACYSGKVVGAACMDGLLIEVDGQYAIGKNYGQFTNVVAAVNLLEQATPELKIDGQVVQPGQTIYFTYTTSPGAREAFCPQNTVPLPIPHLVLSNVGTAGCGVATKGQ